MVGEAEAVAGDEVGKSGREEALGAGPKPPDDDRSLHDRMNGIGQRLRIAQCQDGLVPLRSQPAGDRGEPAGIADAVPQLPAEQNPRHVPGAPLARLEMQALFAQLLPRFPTMRLAVGLDDLRSHDDQITGGLVELPVTW